MKILIGCYPAGKPSDPEVYISAIASALANYPEEIVSRVTDPRTGVQRKNKFLPSVAEIIEACEEEMRPIRAQWRSTEQALRVQAEHAHKKTPVKRAEMLERLDALKLEMSERERGIVPTDKPMEEAINDRIAKRRAVLAEFPLTNIAQEAPE